MGVLFPRAITGERNTISFAFGKARVANTTPLTTVGSIQPYRGRELESLKILRKDKGLVIIRCNDKLNVAKQGDASQGDFVFFDGGRWEVIAEKTHNQGVIDHYAYLAQYVGEV
jgi:hypothetical protein